MYVVPWPVCYLECCTLSVEVSLLLNELEDVLRVEGYWLEQAPSREALSSVEPFCVDTLSCTEWFQWIYIPRLRAIIDQKGILPIGAKVHPYAGEALAGLAAARILDVVARLDAIMSR